MVDIALLDDVAKKTPEKINVDILQVRILNESNAMAFCAIRLHALKEEGQYFAASYEEEASRPLAAWEKACQESCNHAVFGAFIANEMVGMMIATKDTEDRLGHSVRWGSEYVAPECRGKGVRQALYNIREEWSLQQGYTQAFFSIRSDNERSIKSHMRDGAEFIIGKQRTYADGSVAISNLYRRRLKDPHIFC